ncbi:hypothetical protein A7985_06835 [Pseudoalteromonas luteoviolacea]|uniref:Uncharacterized protein n=2 Tax=Pseudoalteromonas luteoviolacea TaxID=43657 RepID=A0A1C0TWG2_9GAMM|nr:hypothetical protein A7985_06835 [Pseudoalteromonas luteoviolacea]
MKKILLPLALTLLPLLSQAGVSEIAGAKIEYVEFYDNQFTIGIDSLHSSKGCGHPGNVVAVDSSKEPGKTQYAALLAVWMANKPINLIITDESCNGDRPTLLHFAAFHR